MITPQDQRILGEGKNALRAFTLVELILVMALMCIVAGVAAPTLGRSLRDRHLEQEGLRLLSMTELARSLAVSQGVPMVFWIDKNGGRYGIEPKAGYDADATSTRDLSLNSDVWFDSVGQSQGSSGSGQSTVEFAPDGLPEANVVQTVRLADKFGGSLLLARTDDGWSYEIVKGGK